MGPLEVADRFPPEIYCRRPYRSSLIVSRPIRVLPPLKLYLDTHQGSEVAGGTTMGTEFSTQRSLREVHSALVNGILQLYDLPKIFQNLLI